MQGLIKSKSPTTKNDLLPLPIHFQNEKKSKITAENQVWLRRKQDKKLRS